MTGTRGQGLVSSRRAELLVPQLIVRRIAHRAMQFALLAAGILTILLVFSRQADAATATPTAASPAATCPTSASSLLPAAVTCATSTVTSAAAPATSAAASAAAPAAPPHPRRAPPGPPPPPPLRLARRAPRLLRLRPPRRLLRR